MISWKKSAIYFKSRCIFDPAQSCAIFLLMNVLTPIRLYNYYLSRIIENKSSCYHIFRRKENEATGTTKSSFTTAYSKLKLQHYDNTSFRFFCVEH